MAEPKKPQTATMFDASAQPTSNGTAESSNGQQASGKTAQTQAPAPVAPPAPPAIPQILVDAGPHENFPFPHIGRGEVDFTFSGNEIREF